MNSLCALGIDTSNYKTSVAVTNSSGEILCNLQKYLTVKKGERGLRQSDALFQHVNQLPQLIEEAFKICPGINIGCISVSEKPRPVDGSYMPVFLAGLSTGKELAAALNVPLFKFSHQEGHIEAVRFYSGINKNSDFISFHFSGGTTESIYVGEDKFTIAGKTKDLALGQVIDRVGVALGMDFPAGAEMDRLALSAKPVKNILAKVKVKDNEMNLSGIETMCQRLIGKVSAEELAYMVFERLSEVIRDLTISVSKDFNTKDILFAGGVSSSSFIRNRITQELDSYNLYFGPPELSGDNAVGISLLGGKNIWL